MKKQPNKVRIIVAGLAGSSKSTIIQVIQEALEKAGVVAVARTDENLMVLAEPPVDKVFQKRRIKAIKDKIYVEVEERNMYHSLTPDNPPRIHHNAREIECIDRKACERRKRKAKK
jgi:hypothetical protein